MSHKISDSPLKSIIRDQFDDHFLWLTESKKGGHTPEISTAKFVIRQYLAKKDPDMPSSQIEKYFTSNNIAMVMKLLEEFYKKKGVFVAKVKSSRSPSSKRKSSHSKSPKKATPKKATPKKKASPKRKSEKESRKSKPPQKKPSRVSASQKRKPAKESRRAGKESRHAGKESRRRKAGKK